MGVIRCIIMQTTAHLFAFCMVVRYIAAGAQGRVPGLELTLVITRPRDAMLLRLCPVIMSLSTCVASKCGSSCHQSLSDSHSSQNHSNNGGDQCV